VKEEWLEIDGRKDGWRADGSLRLEATMKDGEYHGHFSTWWPNGLLMEDGDYDNVAIAITRIAVNSGKKFRAIPANRPLSPARTPHNQTRNFR
jgi:hypothetical protein